MEKRVRGRPRGGGSKLQRTETVTLRLDPKLRYLTELASRKQRRTVSSFIEWAIEQALSSVELDDKTHTTVAQVAGRLWDTDEADRLAKLGIYYPDLLTYDEQVLWKLIQECAFLWRGDRNEPGGWTAQERDEALDYPQLRENWETLKKVASGEADSSELSMARRLLRMAE